MSPSPSPEVRVPAALDAHLRRHAGASWADGLAELTSARLRVWGLRVRGPVLHGMVALVVPVWLPGGGRAVLKMQPLDAETAGEPVALRAWDGRGAVRLLDDDPGTGALLLEALDPERNLERVDLDAALERVGGLLARLHAVPAPAGIRGLGEEARDLAGRADHLSRTMGAESGRARLVGLAARAREVSAEPGGALLHWDLHFANVLAPLPGAEREPWVAIDPKPLAGDGGFDLWPCLHNRWEEAVATGDPGREARRRMELLAEAAGLERDRARAWTLVRVLQECVWALEDGGHGLPPVPVAVAEALGA
ncbi:hydroxyurea phosphotransferase [Nocardiopsis sp. HNM0947]|uniref:Hydroxyurea phosphotransferase n=1 Tax=Nocardiopsis coralli TaxID=2772213 RepID=A0ABR9P6F3_9ACTN|nr:aminoglycoside phosphotransferase family protein [Nocardiopsis coralli]MBE2999422.1 hydroxyurea phosphotransferase [Nocardiopsis coralli]